MGVTMSEAGRMDGAAGETPLPGGGVVNTARHILVIARRNLMKITGDPGLLLDATAMPIVFSLMFVYVLGGAIAGTVADYRQFFMPGIMAMTIAIVSRTTGIGLAVDFGSGVIDRFRSLPIARSAVLSGRILADAVRMLLSQLVVLAVAILTGFRIETGPLAAVSAVALLMAFGIALAWVSAFVGLSMRSVQSAETITTLMMVPLQFGSSLFVPVSTMPAWLRAFVELNPMTLVVDACRGLLIGGPVLEPALKGLAWIAAALVVFAPLAVRTYMRRR
ncbi:ABC transporter permease [Microbispora siamensis]